MILLRRKLFASRDQKMRRLRWDISLGESGGDANKALKKLNDSSNGKWWNLTKRLNKKALDKKVNTVANPERYRFSVAPAEVFLNKSIARTGRYYNRSGIPSNSTILTKEQRLEALNQRRAARGQAPLKLEKSYRKPNIVNKEPIPSSISSNTPPPTATTTTLPKPVQTTSVSGGINNTNTTNTAGFSNNINNTNNTTITTKPKNKKLPILSTSKKHKSSPAIGKRRFAMGNIGKAAVGVGLIGAAGYGIASARNHKKDNTNSNNL